MRRLTLATVWLLGSCRPGAPPAPAPVLAALPTCAKETPRRVEVDFALGEWLGAIGAHTFVLGIVDKHASLAWVDDGRLATFRLPVDGGSAVTASFVEGTRAWFLAVAGESPPQWVSVDLEDVHTPRASASTRLDTLPAGGFIRAFAPGESRALLWTGPGYDARMWDVEARRPIGSAVPFGSFMDAPWMRCKASLCLAIGVSDDGAGRRRLERARFAPDGSSERLELDREHVISWAVVDDGVQHIVVWSSLEGGDSFARVLDADGEPVGERFSVGAHEPITAHLVFGAAGPQGPIFATRAPHAPGFMLVRLSAAHRSVETTTTIGVAGYFLTVGRVREGVLGVGFDSGTSYPHMWHGAAEALFVSEPSEGAAVAPTAVLPRTTGVGRGGVASFPLVAPSWAAVLVAPTGTAQQVRRSELVFVREPCMDAARPP